MSKAQMPRQKHVPQRTCIACRKTQGKREFIRIVRTPEGEVRIDPTGKQAGRGAYLHKSRDCWDQALSGQRLNTALKMTVTPENLATLKAYAATLPVVVATD